MCRELMEETGITAKPVKLLAVHFSEQDWYAAFWQSTPAARPAAMGTKTTGWCGWIAKKRSPAPMCRTCPKLITAAMSGGGLTPIDYAPQRKNSAP